MGISDFTDMSKIGVTIDGASLITGCITFGWRGRDSPMPMVRGSESFAVLVQGLQDALWILFSNTSIVL